MSYKDIQEVWQDIRENAYMSNRRNKKSDNDYILCKICGCHIYKDFKYYEKEICRKCCRLTK